MSHINNRHQKIAKSLKKWLKNTAKFTKTVKNENLAIFKITKSQNCKVQKWRKSSIRKYCNFVSKNVNVKKLKFYFLAGNSNLIFLVSESVHHLKKFGEAVDIASEFKKISFILYIFLKLQIC